MRCLRFTLLIIAASTSVAQTPDTVIAGPYGVPRSVRDEAGQWSTPIKVFSNANEIVYVPDITTPGWAQWHEKDFKEKGLYFTYVYTYWRSRRVTVRETIYVNLRTRRVHVERFLKPPMELELDTSTPEVSKSIAVVTRIVEDSIGHFKGPSLEESSRIDRALVLNNLNVLQERAKADQSLHATQPPRLISSVSPTYPTAARYANISGVVTVGATIDQNGEALNIHIVKSVVPALDSAALQAFSQSKFEPARDIVTGITTSANVTLDFNFDAH